MKPQQVKETLKKIENVNIAVYGDFCLDAYWVLDPRGGEVSVETGLQSQGVGKHYYTLGGASNIVANLVTLKPASIKAIGVVGDDIFGRELVSQLKALGVDTDSMIIQKENFDTVTFAKRYLDGEEQPRVDFGFFNARSTDTDTAVINNLRVAIADCDAVIFNQQVPGSISDEFVARANELFDEFDDKIILLDTRHYGDRFRNVYRKVNDIEATRLSGADADLNDIITFNDVKAYAEVLYGKSHKPVFVTRGGRGILTVDSDQTCQVPGIQLLGKLDTVGAGDTATSAVGLCLGAGVKPADAAKFANFASAVTVQKLFQTGTASGEEILDISKDADYIYQPELAGDIRQASYMEGTEIELCTEIEKVNTSRIKHAVFDHDGTISILRQGWEAIMEPMMIRAVLGDKYETADETL
ncbi:MAG: carbohydrate kinase, partial [Planctomycetes bacterium]|nr:carbohydrate kinase [Planctomycetota bacterium]